MNERIDKGGIKQLSSSSGRGLSSSSARIGQIKWQKEMHKSARENSKRVGLGSSPTVQKEKVRKNETILLWSDLDPSVRREKPDISESMPPIRKTEISISGIRKGGVRAPQISQIDDKARVRVEAVRPKASQSTQQVKVSEKRKSGDIVVTNGPKKSTTEQTRLVTLIAVQQLPSLSHGGLCTLYPL